MAVCPVFAGEYAVLQNGFRIYADRHEIVEGKTRLHTGSGHMELPTGDIVRFEVEEYVPPPPPPPPKTDVAGNEGSGASTDAPGAG